MCEKKSLKDRYEEFGEAVHTYIIDELADGSGFAGEEIEHIALHCGLAREVPFDPQVHGESEDIKPGEKIVVWGVFEEGSKA